LFGAAVQAIAWEGGCPLGLPVEKFQKSTFSRALAETSQLWGQTLPIIPFVPLMGQTIAHRNLDRLVRGTSPGGESPTSSLSDAAVESFHSGQVGSKVVLQML